MIPDTFTIEAAKRLKTHLERPGETVVSLAKRLGVNKGQVSKVIAGKAQASNKMILAINRLAGLERKESASWPVQAPLQLRSAPALPCADCGRVHVVGWCTERHGAPVMAGARRRRKSSPYIRDWPAAQIARGLASREEYKPL